jgi:hypothetical protein
MRQGQRGKGAERRSKLRQQRPKVLARGRRGEEERKSGEGREERSKRGERRKRAVGEEFEETLRSEEASLNDRCR